MKILIQNRIAYHNYTVLDEYTAGIILTGTEVKSLRESGASIQEAFCSIKNAEAYLHNMFVNDYKQIKHTNHPNVQDRKLLLNKKEIIKIYKTIKEKGYTLVPLNIHLSETGFIKVKLGVCKGKNTYNKRNSLKERDLKKAQEKELNN